MTGTKERITKRDRNPINDAGRALAVNNVSVEAKSVDAWGWWTRQVTKSLSKRRQLENKRNSHDPRAFAIALALTYVLPRKICKIFSMIWMVVSVQMERWPLAYRQAEKTTKWDMNRELRNAMGTAWIHQLGWRAEHAPRGTCDRDQSSQSFCRTPINFSKLEITTNEDTWNGSWKEKAKRRKAGARRRGGDKESERGKKKKKCQKDFTSRKQNLSKTS